jgi:TonB-linked SusC/RagA family outer membrane protein
MAQAQDVSGVVKDEKGELLPGVSVQAVGTTIGTSTTIDGTFKIKVKDLNTAVLRFSFIGMQNQDVHVKGQKQLTVVMKTSSVQLEEVVAIGYGIQKKRDITGSVASVKSEAIASMPVASAIEAMSGRLAGVQVTSTEGSPDAEMKIRVRGGGSITGDNSPLYIVDGFPVDRISDIAPSDIESIDVLKDASSTAIYGARGANGVIIVTTKKGKEGKMSVTYNAYYGVKSIAKTLDVLKPYDFAKWQYELALLKDDLTSYTDYFGDYSNLSSYQNTAGTDWQDEVYGRTGYSMNHNLSLTGGSDKFSYAFSYSYLKDKAIMVGSDFKRNNFSLKLNHKPNSKITLDYSFRYSDTRINGGGLNEQNEASSADSRLKHTVIYTPVPLGISGGTDDTNEETFGDLTRPDVAIADNDRNQRRVSYNASASAAWEVFKNFTAKSEVGLDVYNTNEERFYGRSTYYVKNAPASTNQGLPAAILTNYGSNRFRNTNTLNYDFKAWLGGDHSLNLLLGQELLHTSSKQLTNTIHGLPKLFTSEQAFKLTSQGVASSIDNFYNPDDNLTSFFGRANYNYKGRYILSGTFRADGSSKFAKGNRWGYFPSAAAAWRISDESFMQWTESWLNDMKIRFSYGTAGNNNIPSGLINQVFVSTNTEWINGTGNFWAPSKTMANPDLKWETTYTRNIGIDYAFLKSRLTGSFEFYLNTTKDLLIAFPVAGTGYDVQYRNMGETQNKGLEFSMNWIAFDKKDFGLNFNFNIGFNRNKIKSLGMMKDFTAASGWASTDIGADYIIATGGSVGEMYGYKSAGRYEVSDFEGYDAVNKVWTLKSGVADASGVVGTIRPGSMKLRDLDGNGKIDVNDRTSIGNANPKHTGGFSVNTRYKGFDLSAVFNWSYGNDVYNANKIEFTSTSKYQYRNMIDDMADGKRWTNVDTDGNLVNDPTKLAEMNAKTTMWSPYTGRFIFSDWAVEDGSFLRLSTLTLGYNLPSLMLKKVKINSLRLYVTAYNVFCLTNYSGFDPEASTRRQTALTPGVDYSAYPKSRQVVFGVNLAF